MTTATLTPSSDVEVADAITEARAAGSALETRGGGSVLDRLPTRETTTIATTALTGIVAHAAEDLTLTVRAGTPLDELTEALAEHGQECPIEPTAGAGSTVGGRLATGLAGPRQLGVGRVRDWVLRVRFVTGTGTPAVAGGVTVKDVTGYDLCRLLTGSWGTIGVLTEVTLKLRPLPTERRWFHTDAPRPELATLLFRPAGVFVSGSGTDVLLEGHPDDLAAQAELGGLAPGDGPVLPTNARASVDPADLGALTDGLAGLDVQVTTQVGVGVGYLDGPADALIAARSVVERMGGTMLILGYGAPAFGDGARPDTMAARVASALDPDGVLAPWRWTS
jgi:hypothetical protein